jgi:hypothetical protein
MVYNVLLFVNDHYYFIVVHPPGDASDLFFQQSSLPVLRNLS